MSLNVLSYFLTQAGRALLSENMIIVAIVLWTVRGSFRKIEAGLAEITATVKELNGALLNVEHRHATRLDEFEQRVSSLEEHRKKSSQVLEKSE